MLIVSGSYAQSASGYVLTALELVGTFGIGYMLNSFSRRKSLDDVWRNNMETAMTAQTQALSVLVERVDGINTHGTLGTVARVGTLEQEVAKLQGRLDTLEQNKGK